MQFYELHKFLTVKKTLKRVNFIDFLSGSLNDKISSYPASILLPLLRETWLYPEFL